MTTLSRRLRSLGRRRSRRVHGAIAALMVAGLVACTQVPLTALWQLRKFDFENFDPAELRLAVSLPSNVALWPEGLRVDVKISREGAGASVEESFWFRERPAAGAEPALPTLASGRSPWVVLQLSPDDSERLRRWRRELVAAKAANGQAKNKLELKAEPRACLRGGSLAPEASASVALRWQAEPGYVMVLRDRTLAEFSEAPEAATAGLPPCRLGV